MRNGTRTRQGVVRRDGGGTKRSRPRRERTRRPVAALVSSGVSSPTDPPPFGGRYAKQFLAGWGTMDFNGHMANTAYLDLAADVRMAFFAEHGFPPSEFRRLGFGPVVRKDELEYFHEVGLHEMVTVTYAVLAMSPDGARFVIENEIWGAAGERAAVVRSTGGWLHLRDRKLVAPPTALLEAFEKVPRTPDFTELSPLRSGKRVTASVPKAGDDAV